MNRIRQGPTWEHIPYRVTLDLTRYQWAQLADECEARSVDGKAIIEYILSLYLRSLPPRGDAPLPAAPEGEEVESDA